MRRIDDTHDPNLRSWVESANVEGTDFPIQNLPFAVFRRRGDEPPRIGVGIGDEVLDLAACVEAGLLEGLSSDMTQAVSATELNALMAQGAAAASDLRRRLVRLLAANGSRAEPRTLVAMRDVRLCLPASIGDFTDFYASIHHASNVGQLFRPDDPLPPNYRHLPIAYHGRSSSVVVSGTPIVRPSGQRRGPGEPAPTFAPSERLDFELELGAWVGAGNALGRPVRLEEAEDHIFGLSIVNDWSARDIQAWEYQPLGPFLGKSFATTVSPWVVTLEALAPFRSPAPARSLDDPPVLAYLVSERDRTMGGIEIALEALLRSPRMKQDHGGDRRLCRTSFHDMYWTLAQMLAHHTSNGCNLRPGDLIGTGTISGSDEGSLGSLLEITRNGRRPVELTPDESRTFLLDGDEVIFRAWCERKGFVRIGFGECVGTIVPQRQRG
jgi:fumarylacetoacetase